MKLPELTEFATSKDTTEVFSGYNHNLRNSVGEWYNQKNMTADYYPAASPRNKRSVQCRTIQTPIVSSVDKLIKNIDGSVKMLFSKNYAKGCKSLAYTDKRLITLQNVYDENNIAIGCWFTDSGSLAALNGSDFAYLAGNITFEETSETDLSKTVTTYKFTGSDLNNLDVAIGDTVSFYIPDSTINDSTYYGNVEVTAFDDCIVTEKADDSLILQREGILLHTTLSSGPYAAFLNKTKKQAFCDAVERFNLNCDKHHIVRMGSYLCTFPDGIVYETANTQDNIPVFPVARKIEINNVTFKTVVSVTADSDNPTGYKAISLASSEDETGYRFSDGGIQYYIENTNMWVSQQTSVMIYVDGKTGTFDNFKENDTVTMVFKCDKEPDGEDINGSFDGLIKWDAQKNKYTEKSVKIVSKGTFHTDAQEASEENNYTATDGYDTDYIIVDGFQIFTYTSAGTKVSAFYNTGDEKVSFTRKMPDISFACESQNRIWCCSSDGHEIYASALGDPYNFYDYSSLATDSYAVNVGSDGEFTGCVDFLGHPLFFKENSLHYISGSYPSNAGTLDSMSYEVITSTPFKGVEKGSEKSFGIIDNILYYKSAAGIVAYDGASTTVISDALGKEKYKNAVAGVYANKYYVSMCDESGVYHLFQYDTSLGMWCREDNTEIKQFLQVNNELLYYTEDTADDTISYVCSINERNVLSDDNYKKEDDFEWECETGDFGYSYPNNKYLSRFQIRMKMSDNAKAAVFIQYNSDSIWHRKGEMQSVGTRTHLIPIIPIRCDHMKIKIAGKGDVKIYSISKIFEEGGDV